MIKTKIVETIEKYDANGNLVEKTTREETTEDDETRFPFITPNTTSPAQVPNSSGVPLWTDPYVKVTCTGEA